MSDAKSFEKKRLSAMREQLVKRLEVYTDSDWASDQTSRKSTSGAVIMADGMRLHAHSRCQASVALSSCEAEVMAASEGIKEALLLQEVLMFVGLGHHEIEIKVDSSAAHAFSPHPFHFEGFCDAQMLCSTGCYLFSVTQSLFLSGHLETRQWVWWQVRITCLQTQIG